MIETDLLLHHRIVDVHQVYRHSRDCRKSPRVRIQYWWGWVNRFRTSPLDCSLMGPWGTSAQSGQVRAWMRYADDSIVYLFAFVHWYACKRCGQWTREEDNTS